ncbi:MAG: LLM class F420-dependent oxidoreductase [Chloroflexi bacterium]|nr:LLM class F420-dependent oxidoreductase [Chloroflexota bacterium]
MQFGFDVPTQGPLANPENTVRMAKRGEELGYGYLYFSDHIVYPRTVDSPYPYSPGKKLPGAENYLEQLTLISHLAAHTSQVKLLTSVMVVPYRPAVFTAKILSTIDILSKGRLVLGAGAGWMKEEFQAVGAEDFHKRGKVTNEYLRAFKELWTSPDPSFDGDYVQFSDLAFEPKPVQKPHPPIWIGGESPAAVRRAATLGDGWYPISYSQSFPIVTPTEMKSRLAELDAEARKAGRDASRLTITYHAGVYDAKLGEVKENGRRKQFTGSPQQVLGDLKSYQDIGVDNIFFIYAGADADQICDTAEHFMDKVGSKI